jgi:predicted transcriptional regulator
MSTRRRTRSTGVTLELAVLAYLRELAEKEDRNRSFCINKIVREHAERNGRRLETDDLAGDQFSAGRINHVSRRD